MPAVEVARRPGARTLPIIVAIAITAYGGVLRLHVIASRYGPIERPGWARVLTARVAPVARYLEPRAYTWSPVNPPYVGGDPISYLKFARDMRSFYQAHVREPVFLAITRAWLWLLRDQDVGISFASAAMSTAGIFAIYLLGSAAFSPGVGLLAALGWAADYDAVSWASEGWRDDTFTTLFVLTGWTLVRLRQRPRASNAVAAGVAGAAACLTRITSMSWLAPALIMIAIERRDDWRRTLAACALAAGITGALVSPYLVNCARQLGDPLIAINAHTRYYRAGEGLAFDAPQSALTYVRDKLRRRPVYEADTAFTGVFVWPFENKWSGFDVWVPRLAGALKVGAVAGLLLFLLSPDGRVLLVLLVSSLVPYAFTWNIGGGGEWRFTMHAYPIYLLASAYASVCAWRAIASLRDGQKRRTLGRPGPLIAVVSGLLVMVLARVVYARLPYYVQREALVAGEPVTIGAGPRDAVFYTKQWSPWHTDGDVTARVVVGTRGWIALPLPARRAYRLTIRADPVTPAVPHDVWVLLNGRLLGRFGPGWDPQRVGSYSLDVAADSVRPGAAVLQLVADAAIPARAAGPRYAWIEPSTPVSLRVWYVRIHPS